MKQLAADIVLGSLGSLEISRQEETFLKEFKPAGLTLFGRNIPENGTAIPSALCKALLKNYSKPEIPFLIAIDQEGGRVARLKKPFPDYGPAMAYGKGLPEPTQKIRLTGWGREVATALHQTGIAINFAPVADTLSEPDNDAIGDRSFATTAESVLLRAGAFLDGLKQGGVLPCLKHFPGQGAARLDTHQHSCEITASSGRLFARDILPFSNLAHRTPMIMMSHCIYPALDHREASLSPVIMGNLLRKDLGFKGCIVTDDMTMGAISRKAEKQEELIVESISQGADLALVCEGLEAWQLAIEALQKEAEKSMVLKERLREASGRVRAMARSWKAPSIY